MALQPTPSSNTINNGGIGGWGGSALMSGNINRFLVSPWSPDQASKTLQGPNLLADTISAYTTGGSIQIESTMNIVPPNTITYDGKAILPYQINGPNSLATTLNDGTEGYFEVTVSTNNPGATANLLVTPTYTTIGNDIGPNYNFTIDGYLNTSNTVTINSPSPTALQVNGNVNITGTVSLSNVQVTKLGIGTSVAPGYVFDVSGNSLFKGSAGITGYLGVGKQTPTLPLDVLGSAAISNNITIGNNTITQAIGVGKPTITSGLAADIAGNTNISGTLGVANNVTITSSETTIIGHTAATDISANNIQLSNNLITYGNIGINIYPSYDLDVNGSTHFNGSVRLDNGDLTVTTNDIRVSIGTVFSSNINTCNVYTSNIYTSNIYAKNTYLSNIYTSNVYTSNVYTSNVYTINTYSSNIDASNIYATIIHTPTIDASNVYTINTYSSNVDASNIHATLIESSYIDASSIDVSNLSVSSVLEVSGISIFTGGITINQNADPSGYRYNNSNNINIYNSALQIQPTNNAYLIAPTSIQVIQYNPNSTGPGWIQYTNGDVSLNLVFNPTTYIIDGSVTDTSMNIQIVPLIGQLDTPVPGSNCPYPGITYTFVARNAPPEGHQIIYPYSTTGTNWWNNLTCNIIIQEPFHKALICVGTNDYSST